LPADNLKLAYTVNEYCAAHGFSRAHLYNLWRRGEGPRRMKVGSRTLISPEAAEDYRLQCEIAEPPHSVAADNTFQPVGKHSDPGG
jgi:hypothetical protein